MSKNNMRILTSKSVPTASYCSCIALALTFGQVLRTDCVYTAYLLAHSYSLSQGEAEARLGFSHPELHNKFEASLPSMRPSLQNHEYER